MAFGARRRRRRRAAPGRRLTLDRDAHRRDVGAGRAVLARAARSMALVGNGAQSEFQALAFRDLVGIRELRLFDTDPAASAKLVANPPVRDSSARSRERRRRGARRRHRDHGHRREQRDHVTPQMIEPGMHVNAVGGDCPGKTDAGRAEAAKIVEYEPQTRIEGGSRCPPTSPSPSSARARRPRRPTQRAAGDGVFDSVGFARSRTIRRSPSARRGDRALLGGPAARPRRAPRIQRTLRTAACRGSARRRTRRARARGESRQVAYGRNDAVPQTSQPPGDGRHVNAGHGTGRSRERSVARVQKNQKSGRNGPSRCPDTARLRLASADRRPGGSAERRGSGTGVHPPMVRGPGVEGPQDAAAGRHVIDALSALT